MLTETVDRADGSAVVDGALAIVPVAAKRITHRQFLKGLAALGVAGLGALTLERKSADASYITGPPDRVNTDLQVDGKLTVGNSVGVGTTTPERMLDVKDSSNFQVKVSGTSAANGASLRVYNDAGSAGAVAMAGSSPSGAPFGMGANAFGVGSITSGPTILGTNNVERVRIDTSGKVGVGTTSPGQQLEVAGGGIGILGASNDNANPLTLTLSYESYGGRLQSFAGHPIAINPLGNKVGIGTTAPVATLDIYGDLQTTGNIKINGVVVVDTSNTAKQAYFAP